MFIPRAKAVLQIQEKIGEKLGPQKYRVWFKNATRFTMADGHLEVSTPNAFICNWIERNFADAIAEAAREVTEKEIRIAFSVDSKLLHALKKRQLDSQAEYVAKNPERVARQYRRQGGPPPRKLRGRFDDLVVGPANELAVSVCRRIAERDPNAYSPVFIHGGCGLGKTHLLQAIGNELASSAPDCRWAYLTGDEFTNAFVLALRSQRIESFRQQYRHVDVLIIDDVHFLANKKATQEEFLHTFNAIESRSQKIVLASDAHPRVIGHFSDQLRNRFVAGMVVRIDVPDLRMRCQILRHRARQAGMPNIPDDVLLYIAERLQSNVRELEGALLKLVMFGKITHQSITLSLARQALADHLERAQRSLGLEEIDQTVATYFGMTPAEIHSSRKTRTIALARSVAMYLARKHTDMSFPEIGRSMGNKNHSTVILANRKIETMLGDDALISRQTPAGLQEERLRELVDTIEQELSRFRATRPEKPLPYAPRAVTPPVRPPIQQLTAV